MADNAYEDATSQLWEVEGLFARDVDGQLIRVVSATEKDYAKDVTLTIDGQTVTVKKAVPTTDSQGNVVIDQDGKTIPRSTTIYDAAAKLFVKKPGDVNPIPVLCHQEHMNPAGVWDLIHFALLDWLACYDQIDCRGAHVYSPLESTSTQGRSRPKPPAARSRRGP